MGPSLSSIRLTVGVRLTITSNTDVFLGLLRQPMTYTCLLVPVALVVSQTSQNPGSWVVRPMVPAELWATVTAHVAPPGPWLSGGLTTAPRSHVAGTSGSLHSVVSSGAELACDSVRDPAGHLSEWPLCPHWCLRFSFPLCRGWGGLWVKEASLGTSQPGVSEAPPQSGDTLGEGRGTHEAIAQNAPSTFAPGLTAPGSSSQAVRLLKLGYCGLHMIHLHVKWRLNCKSKVPGRSWHKCLFRS